ncbi:Sorting nexin-14 [Chamberlinius hualienensis]
MFEVSSHHENGAPVATLDSVHDSSSKQIDEYEVILVAPVFHLLIRHKYFICMGASVTFLSVIVYWIYSLVMSLLMLGACFGGVILVCAVYSSSFQNFMRSGHKATAHFNVKEKPAIIACGVCLTPNCERHVDFGYNPSFNYLWHPLEVSRDIDETVEDFLNQVMEKYIYSWHQEISHTESFIYELKLGIRWAISNLLKRTEKIYLPTLITQKLLRAALSHVDSCLQASLKRDERGGSEGAIFDYYGADLHVAVFNRECELNYLRGLTQTILPYLVPPGFLESRSMTHLVQEILSGPILMSTMDTIADPDIINDFLLVIFDKTPITRYPPDTEPKLLFLERFAPMRDLVFVTQLSEEISYTKAKSDYLYPLMKFMKRERTISVLQFCLEIDEFSATLLNPELKDDDLRKLHMEAKKLYEMYMSSTGSDQLNFDENVVEEFRSIVEGPYQDITRLQSTEPLYQAHEYAFKLLEKHLPAFYDSFEYYEQICGSKLSLDDGKLNRKRSSKHISAAARIGSKINKIRGALMPVSAIDGSIEEYSQELADSCFEADELKLGLDMDVNGEMDDLSVRDLSAWRVFIPRVETRKDERNKLYYVFIIEVHRIDIKNKGDLDEFNWTVERPLQEFYVLEAKLTEFHGDSVDIHLPSKRSFGNKGLEYMESKRPALEEFLQRLLQKPVFRGSELLFTFLSSAGDFTKGLLPDINLGRMIKNVPMKLVKERGQHLEIFLQNFISSTETPKLKSNKNEYKDNYVPPSSLVTRKLLRTSFADNAGRRLDTSPLSVVRLKSILKLDCLSDAILYLAVKVLKMQGWTLNILNAFIKTFGTIFDDFINSYLHWELQQALVPKRIAIWIRLLKEAVFKDSSKRSNMEKAARAKEALIRAQQFLPRLLVQFIGSERHDVGIETLFKFLQHPRLNKQLSYTLLDIIAMELFPELRENQSEDRSNNVSEMV